MAEAGLAARKKNARRLNATIAFLDESGFMLQPLVRRSWAPKGQTPIIRCWDRRDRLSVTAAITCRLSGGARPPRLGATFRIQQRNVKTADTLAFLRALERHVGGQMIVIMDRLNVHRAAARRWLAKRPQGAPRVIVEWLPAYAPELNPVEQIWNRGKGGDLANLAPSSAADLRCHVRRALTRQQRCPPLLASFFALAGLPL